MPVIGNTSGVAAIEFALLLPVLLFFAVSALELGSEYNDFIVVTNAAQAGTFQLTVSRGASTPWTGTRNAVFLAAPGLTQANLTITLTVNGTACASDSACLTALGAAPGQSATVSVSYPCHFTNLQMGNLQWNIPGCPLTARSTGRVQ